MELNELNWNKKNGQHLWEMKISEKDTKDALNSVYKEAQKYATIPGFRKGKTPKKILEQRFGKEYFIDACKENIAKKALQELVKKETNFAAHDLDFDDFNYDGFSLKITLFKIPELESSDYTGIPVTVKKMEVKEELVDETIETMRKRMATLEPITDRDAELNDKVKIDFEGYIDGEKFAGGSGSDYELVLGSNSFIPGMEEQICGMKIDEEKDIKVTFPEDYHAKKYAGKPAVFKIKLHEIKKEVLPEINDDFAKDVGYEDIKDMKKKTRERLENAKEEENKNQIIEQTLDEIDKRLELKVPETLIEKEIDYQIEKFSYDIKKSYPDFKLEQFLAETKQDISTFRQSYRVRAEKSVKGQMLLQAVIKAEKIDMSDEEIKNNILDISKKAGISEEMAEKYYQNPKIKQSLIEDLKVQKAIDILVDAADVKFEEVEQKEEN